MAADGDFNVAWESPVTGPANDTVFLRPYVRKDLMSGRAFLDLNGDGRRDAADPPIGGTTVYLDSNANGSFDNSVASFFSNEVPRRITSSTVALSSLEVRNQLPIIRDVN